MSSLLCPWDGNPFAQQQPCASLLPDWVKELFRSSAVRAVLKTMKAPPTLLEDMAHLFVPTALADIRKMAMGDVEARPLDDVRWRHKALVLAVSYIVACHFPDCRAVHISVGGTEAIDYNMVQRVVRYREKHGMPPLTHITLVGQDDWVDPRRGLLPVDNHPPTSAFCKCVLKHFPFISIVANAHPDSFGVRDGGYLVLRAAFSITLNATHTDWKFVLQRHPRLERLTIDGGNYQWDVDKIIAGAATAPGLRHLATRRWTPSCSLLTNLTSFEVKGKMVDKIRSPFASPLTHCAVNDLPSELPPSIRSLRCRLVDPAQPLALDGLPHLEALDITVVNFECGPEFVDALTFLAPTLRRLSIGCRFASDCPPLPHFPRLEHLVVNGHMREADLVRVIHSTASSPLRTFHIFTANVRLPDLVHTVCSLSATVEDVQLSYVLVREDVVRIISECRKLRRFVYHKSDDFEPPVDVMAAHPTLGHVCGVWFATDIQSKWQLSNAVWRGRKQLRRDLAAWRMTMALILAHRSRPSSSYPTPPPPIERVPWHFHSVRRTLEEFLSVEREGDDWLMIH